MAIQGTTLIGTALANIIDLYATAIRSRAKSRGNVVGKLNNSSGIALHTRTRTGCSEQPKSRANVLKHHLIPSTLDKDKLLQYREKQTEAAIGSAAILHTLTPYPP